LDLQMIRLNIEVLRSKIEVGKEYMDGGIFNGKTDVLLL